MSAHMNYVTVFVSLLCCQVAVYLVHTSRMTRMKIAEERLAGQQCRASDLRRAVARFGMDIVQTIIEDATGRRSPTGPLETGDVDSGASD